MKDAHRRKLALVAVWVGASLAVSVVRGGLVVLPFLVFYRPRLKKVPEHVADAT